MLGREYDVAVVGAGPAGSTAARVIAERGHRVIILERRRSVGVPVQCAEFLPTPTEISDMFPKSPRMARLVEPSPGFVVNRTSHIRLVSPKGGCFEFGFQANILDRSRYDADLAEKAAKAGADLALSSRVVARKSSKMLSVCSREEMMDIKARVIVGADGPASIIARSIGASYRNRERDLSPSLHRVLSDVRVDPRVTEMIFGSQAAPGGYSWIIPSGRSVANVGVGVRRSLVGAKHSLRDCLDHVVQRMDRTSKMLSGGRIVRSVGALIPAGGPVRSTVSRNTIIVGDAAGHVMASNGGGIPTALAGGEIAGEAVSNHLEQGKPLHEYENTWSSEFGEELMRSLAALRFADRVMMSDALTEVGMQIMRARFLEPVIRCRLPLPSGLPTQLAKSAILHILG